MKELSYRVYDKTERWYIDRAFSIDQLGLCYVQDEDGYWEEADEERYIVEQCTGLKDKNGKEIYEGDIVEYDWYVRNDKSYRVKEKVVFDDMGARLGNDRIRNCSNIEVIGNVHENADLLEEEE